MKTFRRVYVYNSEKPVYSSSNAKTYQCLNNETGDKRLIIIHHLKQLPVVELNGSVLQPIEEPTKDQPFSVYPITHCVSEVGKIEEHDAMYFIKCILESSQKQPMYCVMSPKGICTSNVEGILPQPSPKLFDLAIGLLDVPSNLATTPKTMISRECNAILRGLRDGQSVLSSVNVLGGWKDKKQTVNDSDYWVFKGRRKEEGILGQEYGLAWSVTEKLGLVRFKSLDMKQDYDRANLQDFKQKIDFMMDNQKSKLDILKIYKCQDDKAIMKIFTQNPNQATLNEYLAKRKDLSYPVKEEEFFPILQNFVDMMRKIVPTYRAHSTLHIKYLYMDYNTILLGQPMFVTEKAQKKLRELRNSMDYFAPQIKQNIIIRQNIQKLDLEKADIWSFGFVLHKIFNFQLPVFDPSRKPIIKENRMSSGLVSLIQSCLRLNPNERPRWADIDFMKIKREKKDQIEINEVPAQEEEKKEIIRLGSRKQSVRARSPQKLLEREDEPSRNITSPIKKQSERKVSEAADRPTTEVRLNDELLDVQEQMMIKRPETPVAVLPTELSVRLKKIKLVFKLIVIFVMYLAIFFGPFLSDTIALFATRGKLNPVTLKSIDSTGTVQSSVTVLTDNPQFFMLNDITFGDVQDKYHCINNQFDPLYNPSFSLNTYIQTNNFIGVMVAGWVYIVLVLIAKGMLIWNAGISNKTQKDGWKYWVIYAFEELSIACLLYAHFYLFEFFYFCKVSPCFSIQSFNGIEPYFDSILYLFLSNLEGYFQNVFATMCLFSLLMYGSILYHSVCLRRDVKDFFSAASIFFRVLPILAFLIICRIGVFKLYAPTAIDDPLTMLKTLVNSSFNGFIGVIPQVFILMCIVVELLLELLFYYCEKSAAKSDTLNKLFNVERRKVQALDGLEVPQDSVIMSKNQLDISELR